MNSFLTLIIRVFETAVINIFTKVTGVFASIVTELPDDEAQILHDSIDKFVSDRKAGKTFGEAAADALTVFYNEERGEVSKITLKLFQAFLAAVEDEVPAK